MVRSRRSRWFIAFASAVGAGALPAAGAADTGGVPVDPPACVSVLPTLTITCPQPAPPQPQTANPVSAQSTQSQAGPSSVSAIPGSRTIALGRSESHAAHVRTATARVLRSARERGNRAFEGAGDRWNVHAQLADDGPSLLELDPRLLSSSRLPRVERRREPALGIAGIHSCER